MMTIDEMQALLEEIVSGFPPEFFRELNGGVLLLPDTVEDENSEPDDPLFVMGEYHRGGGMGRYIAIYYGSFAEVFGLPEAEDGAGETALREEIREELVYTLKHEFRHHLESLAGSDDLEREDAARLASYLGADDED